MKDRVEGRAGTEGEHPTNKLMFALQIGFFAGVIWGTLRWIFYEMHFTRALPGYFLEPFFRHDFLGTIWGIAIGIAGFTLLSIAASLIYMAVLGKLRGPWPGLLFGVAGWVVLFVLLGPVAGMTDRLAVIGWNTILTELCVFAMWGLFIGFSIAFEFTDEATREPMGAK